MIRKIIKLIRYPNLYFYDYFRKKLGFKKYFVTDKIRLLDAANYQGWFRLPLTHPYLYLYYKLNKKLRNPTYPILVDYRIEDKEIVRGGGKCPTLAVELEKHNIIYFSDPEVVENVIAGKEIDFTGIIFKCNFNGIGNSILINGGVKAWQELRIKFLGDGNCVYIGPKSYLKGGEICFVGNNNTLEIEANCTFYPGLSVNFERDDNYLYCGPNSRFGPSSTLNFAAYNGLIFLYGNQTIKDIDARVGNGSIIFLGERVSNSGDVHLWAWAAKNILIGSDVMMSRFLLYRTSDVHLIYNKSTYKRINNPKSIIIGDHVWIGQSSTLLKGASIEDGSIIGACSIVTGHIPKYCIAVGSPAKVIKNDVFWDRTSETLSNISELTKYDTYMESEKKYNHVGYNNLLKIDAIFSEIKAKEKLKLIQNILHF